MQVDEITPDVDRDVLLPGAQFADAYRIAIDHAAFDAHKVQALSY